MDVVDQRNAAVAPDHSSKTTPWHRVHDFFVNMSFTLAFEHYKVVINDKGSVEQKEELRKLINKSDEGRWLLLEQITEDIRFGTLPAALSQLDEKPKQAIVATPVPTFPAARLSYSDVCDLSNMSSRNSSKHSSHAPSRPPSSIGLSTPTSNSQLRDDHTASGYALRTPAVELSMLSLCEIAKVAKADRAYCALEGCSEKGVSYGCQTCCVRMCFGCYKLHKQPGYKLKITVPRTWCNWIA